VLACLDNTLRRLGGAPTYLLTDNERTLTSDRVAGLPVRHPDLVPPPRPHGHLEEALAGKGVKPLV